MPLVPAGPGAPCCCPSRERSLFPSPVCASFAPDSKSGLEMSEWHSLGQHLAAREAVEARVCHLLHCPTRAHYEGNPPNLGGGLKIWLARKNEK